jgi:hypothetical protein
MHSGDDTAGARAAGSGGKSATHRREFGVTTDQGKNRPGACFVHLSKVGIGGSSRQMPAGNGTAGDRDQPCHRR